VAVVPISGRRASHDDASGAFRRRSSGHWPTRQAPGGARSTVAQDPRTPGPQDSRTPGPGTRCRVPTPVCGYPARLPAPGSDRLVAVWRKGPASVPGSRRVVVRGHGHPSGAGLPVAVPTPAVSSSSAPAPGSNRWGPPSGTWPGRVPPAGHHVADSRPPACDRGGGGAGGRSHLQLRAARRCPSAVHSASAQDHLWSPVRPGGRSRPRLRAAGVPRPWTAACTGTPVEAGVPRQGRSGAASGHLWQTV